MGVSLDGWGDLAASGDALLVASTGGVKGSLVATAREVLASPQDGPAWRFELT